MKIPGKIFWGLFTFLTQANCLENQRQSTENQLSGNSAFHKKLLVELLTIFVLKLLNWVTTWFYEVIRPLLKPYGKISHKFSRQKLSTPCTQFGQFFCNEKILFFALFKTEWKCWFWYWDGFPLVSYPTRWSLLFIIGFLYGSSISSSSKQQRNIVQLCATKSSDSLFSAHPIDHPLPHPSRWTRVKYGRVHFAEVLRRGDSFFLTILNGVVD